MMINPSNSFSEVGRVRGGALQNGNENIHGIKYRELAQTGRDLDFRNSIINKLPLMKRFAVRPY